MYKKERKTFSEMLRWSRIRYRDPWDLVLGYQRATESYKWTSIV
jgi:hypothetical protein